MGKYTWAYINTTAEATATTATGISGSIQFKGESARFDGDANLTFDQGRNQLQLTGTLDVQGDITARNYQLERVTVAHRAGPTAFGNDNSDTHAFTGDITVSDALTVTGESTLNDLLTINQDDNQVGLYVNKTNSSAGVLIQTDANQTALKIQPAAQASGQTVFIDTDGHTNGIGLFVGDDGTTGDKLSGGNLAKFYSNSTNNSARSLVYIHNDSTSATGAKGLKIAQDASAVEAIEVLGPSGVNILRGSDEGVILGGATSTYKGALHVYSNDDTRYPAITINASNTADQRDARIHWALGGTNKYTLGIDDSDSDKLKFSTTSITTNTFLEANSSGQLTHIGTGTPSNGEVLTYDGSKWVPASVSVQSAKQLVNTAGSASVYTNTNIMMHLDTNDNSSITGGNYLALHDGDGLARLKMNETGQMFLLGTTGSSGTSAQLYLSGSNNGADTEPRLVFRKTDTAGSMAAGHNLGSIYFQGSKSTKADDLTALTIVGEVATARTDDATAETWADSTARGSQLKFSTTDIGGNSLSPRFLITPLGVQVEGRIYGPNDANLIIASDKNVNIRLDEDNDTSNAFNIINGGGASALTVFENGNTTIAGTTTITGSTLIGTGADQPLAKVTVQSTATDALADTGVPANYHLMLKRHANTDGAGPGLSFCSSDGNTVVGAAIIHDRTDAGSKGHLKFYTKQAIGSVDPALVLTLTDAGVTQIANNLEVGGGYGSSGVTIASNGNISADGDIIAGSLNASPISTNTINSYTDNNLSFRADADMYFDIDQDNDATFAKFDFRDGDNDTIFQISSGSDGAGLNQPDGASFRPTALARVGHNDSSYTYSQVVGGWAAHDIVGRFFAPVLRLVGPGTGLSDGMDIGSIGFFADETDGLPGDSGTDMCAQITVEATSGTFAPNSDMPTRMDFRVARDGESSPEISLRISGHNSEAQRVAVCSTDYDPPARFCIKQNASANTAAGARGGLWLEQHNSNDGWAIHVDNGDELQFSYSDDGLASIETAGGYMSNSSQIYAISFTGQHRNYGDAELYASSSVGLIVCSTGKIRNLDLSTTASINTSLPELSLSTQDNDKRVFGVVSDSEDENDNQRKHQMGAWGSKFEKQDNRLIVNSIGEGAVWVCDANGNLDNGDYITTCTVPGHGALQADDLLHNYTVAKITQDCTFDLNSTEYACEEYEHNGTTYKRALVGCTYHCG